MALIREKDSKRLHLKSKLMGESLVGKTFLKSLEYERSFRVFPDVSILKIGGQSITDIGAKAILPVIEEIVDCAKKHKMIISTGGGTRSRHVYAVAMELGMPTGIIAKLGQSVSEQNSLMISTLLAPHGGIKIGHDDIPKLGAYFAQGCIPVIHGMPPYGYWEPIPTEGRLPQNRTDVGAYLLAEVIGSRQCIYVKDVDGLYTDNPKIDSEAELIPRIGARELIDKNLEDLVIERAVLDYLCCANNVFEIRIINGLIPGSITKALEGEEVGSVIYREEAGKDESTNVAKNNTVEY